MRRPLALGALFFIAGCALAQWKFEAAVAALALACTGAAAALLLPAVARRQALLIAALFLAAGAGTTLLHSPALRAPLPEHPPYWRAGTTEATVMEAPVITERMDYASLIAETNAGERVLLRWTAPFPIYPGQRIAFRGEATTLLGTVNFGLHTAEDFYRAHGVRYAVSLKGTALRVLETPRCSPRYWVGLLREWEYRLLARACPPDVVPFLAAVWMGERHELSEEEALAYTRSGTMHMLSVSGLHVALIYFSLEFLLAGLLRRPKLRAALIIAAVVIFALMAGGRVATMRSAFMIAFYLSARFVNREPDSPTSISLCAMLFLLWNPRWITDAGALLSFASVGSLLLYAGPLTRGLTGVLRLPQRAASPIAACLAVQVLTLPLTAACFQMLPLVAPLANLVVLPVLDAVLWLCIAINIAGLAMPSAALLFGHATWPLVRTIETAVQCMASWDSLVWQIPPPAVPALLLYTGAVLLPAIAAGPRIHVRDLPDGASPRVPFLRRRSTIAAATLLAASLVLWTPPQPRAQVDFLDVGHGDATVIWPPGGGVVLVDGGDRSEYRDVGAQIVAPFLAAHGVTRLDAVVLSHPDRDHIGGLFAVIDRFEVGQVFLSYWMSGRDLEEELLRLCNARGVAVTRLKKGDEFSIGGARFEALHPPAEFQPPVVNDASLVLRVSWPREAGVPFSLLMPGDIEMPAERVLQHAAPIAAALHVPHHGSSTSSSNALLNAVSPSVAIVSTRTTPRRKAMGPGVEERYSSRDIPLWRTDLHGGLRLDAERFTFQGARPSRWSRW